MLNLDSPDSEALADRVISNDRLIELLVEKDRRVYVLEAELSDLKDALRDIGRFHRAISSISP